MMVMVTVMWYVVRVLCLEERYALERRNFKIRTSDCTNLNDSRDSILFRIESTVLKLDAQ